MTADSTTWRVETKEVKTDSWVNVVFTWSKDDGLKVYQDDSLLADSYAFLYSTNTVSDQFTHLRIGRTNADTGGGLGPNIQVSDLRILDTFQTKTQLQMYNFDKGK